jgi:hypothetical protein
MNAPTRVNEVTIRSSILRGLWRRTDMGGSFCGVCSRPTHHPTRGHHIDCVVPSLYE